MVRITVFLLAISWLSKKSMVVRATVTGNPNERLESNLYGLSFLRSRDLKQNCLSETKCAGQDHIGELFPADIISHDRVIVGLSGKGNLIFRCRELFHELHHGLIGLEVRICLRKGKKASQRAAQCGLSSYQALDCIRISGICCHPCISG